MKKNLIIPILTTACFLIISCSKGNLEEAEETAELEEIIALDNELDFIDALSDFENLKHEAEMERRPFPPEVDFGSDCATRSWERGENSRILTIDFGDEPCLGKDGLYRRGKIIITYTGPRRTEGATREIVLNDYFVMNKRFNGTKTITFLGNNTHSRVVEALKISFNGKTSVRNVKQKVERIAGYDTIDPHDDIFLVNGHGSGRDRKGREYTSEITTPLLKKLESGCSTTFVDGVNAFSFDDGTEISISYDPIGGAPCDRLGMITKNGESKLITLR